MTRSRPAPAQSAPVFRASDLHATDGANLGDTLSFASELVLDDVYELPYGVTPHRLSLLPSRGRRFVVASDTDVGTPGSTLHLDSALMFMSPDGSTQEALLMVEVDEDGAVAEIYLLPLAQLVPQVEYRLVGIDTDTARQKFAQVACVSFTRGTHITLASGEQRRIEDLRVGDRVLTRDDGVQAVRWIGDSTVRAVGEFAPIRIAAGTLNNENDLIVSPDHRYIYGTMKAGRCGRAVGQGAPFGQRLYRDGAGWRVC